MRRKLDPTSREIETLRAVAEHGTIRLAASHLHYSHHTLDTHLDRLRRKSGLRYLPQLVAWAARNGWLDDTTPEE
jgi:DNA-binding CsgD family transcriptional regulator